MILDGLLGFTGGVMVAASFWSLLAPGIEMSPGEGFIKVLPASIGFALGALFIFLLDKILPHIHINFKDSEGIKTPWHKTTLLVLAITLHNIPEGLAVGVLFGGVSLGLPEATISGAVVLALGIGGMLAALNATVAEFSNARYRSLVLPLMVTGYPLGAFLGGMLASNVLEAGDWRGVFYLGAVLTIAAIPLSYWLIPETPDWLSERRPVNALKRINKTLERFGLPTATALPDKLETKNEAALGDILRPPLLSRTVLLTLAYLTHVTAYYYFVKWIPKLVVDMGFDAGAGGDVLTKAMLGGAIGGGLLGVFALRIGIKKATIIALAGAFVMLNVFGRAPHELVLLGWIAGVTAFFSNAAAVGFYALLAMAFPPRVRATGTGFGIGFGRAGAAMGPALAGVLFARGLDLASVSLIISVGSALSIAAILMVRISTNAEAK